MDNDQVKISSRDLSGLLYRIEILERLVLAMYDRSERGEGLAHDLRARLYESGLVYQITGPDRLSELLAAVLASKS